MYGPNQRSGGFLRQFWRWLRLRNRETAPLQPSMRRAVEHRALMAIAIGDLGRREYLDYWPWLRSTAGGRCTRTLPRPGSPDGLSRKTAPSPVRGNRWARLHDCQISHGDLRSKEITIDDGTARFGGFGSAEYGATDEQLQADVAQLLVTTSELYGAEAAVGAAVDVFGKDAVLMASRRLTRSGDAIADPQVGGRRRRRDVRHPRRSEADRPGPIRSRPRRSPGSPATRSSNWCCSSRWSTSPTRSSATVPAFFSELRTANWWWALLGLTVSALTYIGAAASLWACADGLVSFRNLVIMQVANTFAATTTPAGVGGLALSTRFLQKGGLGALRATAARRTATNRSGHHPRRVADLLQLRRGRLG